MKFYDREKELEVLRRTEEEARNNARLTVVMGRRRIGKTSLILKSLEEKDYAYLFVSRESEPMLCAKFQAELTSSIGLEIYGKVNTFAELMEIVMKESTKRHFTIVIDEIQGLYRINPAAFSQLQDIWDRYHRQSKINLICCGSIHTLMKRIFEDKSEPLYGRATSRFTIRPFSTATLREILGDYNKQYQPEDLLTLYMITGGVAKYVELLMDARCTTSKAMLDYVCRQDSYFLTEGRSLVSEEFSSDYSTYFSILQLIANGMTRVSEIDSVLGRASGVYLTNLEKNYELIERQRPMFAKATTKVSKYSIVDNFLMFWFRFINPFQSVIERGRMELVRSNIDNGYAQYSGIVLERYFRDKLMESGKYTDVGNWWDRRGENEIDVIAVNSIDNNGIVAEVKRNRQKASFEKLSEKVQALPKTDFGRYHFDLQVLSPEDM